MHIKQIAVVLAAAAAAAGVLVQPALAKGGKPVRLSDARAACEAVPNYQWDASAESGAYQCFTTSSGPYLTLQTLAQAETRCLRLGGTFDFTVQGRDFATTAAPDLTSYICLGLPASAFA